MKSTGTAADSNKRRNGSEPCPELPEQATNPEAKKYRALTDRFTRTVDYVRIALTSACNLRCSYCMQENHQVNTPWPMQLQTGEIGSVIRILAGMGIKKVRFTGGEPLLRPDIVELVRTAKAISGIETVKITTNGVLLDRNLEALLAAGIDGINLSLDTLDRDRYLALTRRDEFRRVEKMLYELLGIPSLKLKINVLLLRGVNSDEIRRFAELTRHNAITVRFMELQPFDDRQIWRTGRFMGADLIRSALFEEYPSLTQVTGSATEHFSFSLPGYKGMLAVIPAYTRNFCSRCTRLRITADGKILSCLYSSNSENLLLPLRNGAGRDELEKIIRRAVEEKPEDGRKTGNNSRGTSMSEIGG